MFYEPKKQNHGLPRNPFKACVAPRPIGWISSQDKAGNVNLAPYSFFNAIADDPPLVMFASNGVKADEGGRMKDSVSNIEETGEFVANMAVWDLREQMNLTSAPLPHGESEAAAAGLEMLPSNLVKPPRVAAAPANMECTLWKIIELPSGTPGQRNTMVIGEVIGIHIRDDALTDGFLDLARAKPLGRLGYLDYVVVDAVFQMQRPKGGG